jgi:hypothetical protein
MERDEKKESIMELITHAIAQPFIIAEINLKRSIRKRVPGPCSTNWCGAALLLS